MKLLTRPAICLVLLLTTVSCQSDPDSRAPDPPAAATPSRSDDDVIHDGQDSPFPELVEAPPAAAQEPSDPPEAARPVGVHKAPDTEKSPELAAAAKEDEPAHSRDLAAIRAAGEILMLTPTNATSYFLYRGEPMGFEYELMRQFAEENHLTLRVEVVSDPTTLLDRLDQGAGDIAAGRLARTDVLEGRIAYTRPLYQSDPVLVQQERPIVATDLPPEATQAASGRSKTIQEIEAGVRLIEKPWQLAGKRVDVPQDSAYERTLIELEDSISGDIHVVEVQTGDEALIKRVAEGQITYTVAHENIGRLTEVYFTNLKIKPILGETHEIVWALPAASTELLAALNAWLEGKERSGHLAVMYRKYFADRRAFTERVESEYLTSATGKLSPFDDLLRRYAPSLGWDWRLLASQAYQESRFNPKAKSWAGAAGLLQLMPRTAKEVGVTDLFKPEDNVSGAVRFLQSLQTRWADRIADEKERLKFILASYNVGPGHVDDARRLAEKYGGDPQSWRDVSYWLLEKSKAKIAADPVVKFGYCRGIEPVMYVERILERFEHYRQFVET
ncbi:MAG TPA: transporter substrate-binding domain-containing protein [Candidatus Limnocylindrales bacterium]|nr:transporter substrate-binding domain-containing protein [Candidatus Limnocylindrales bacterium]